MFGKQVKIVDTPTGDLEFAGMIGTIINISPDHCLYYIEFINGVKEWIKSKNIEGVRWRCK